MIDPAYGMAGEDSGPGVQFRQMTIEDIPAVVGIEQEAFTAPWSPEAFMNELRHNHFARYTVMEFEGSIIGYGGMWTIMDEAHVTNVAVRSAYRGRGFGELLLRELQQKALTYGSTAMTLEVRVSNEIAQNLYRKLGFKPSGLRPKYYTDNQEDALIMWADLSGEGGFDGGN